MSPRYWRVLVRVVGMDDAGIEVIVPGWNTEERVQVPRALVPGWIFELAHTDGLPLRLHVRANLQAQRAEALALSMSDWESE